MDGYRGNGFCSAAFDVSLSWINVGIGDSISYIADVIGWDSNGVFYALSGNASASELRCGYNALSLANVDYGAGWNVGVVCLPVKKRSKEPILTSL